MSGYMKNDIFGSYQLACECLNDHERTIIFKNNIEKIVDSTKNVLELGAGTGILSLFAANSGARHVDAVEITKPVADIARNNLKRNGFDDRVSVLNKDAISLRRDDLSAIPDVVLMEMISTGLIEELQVPAFNNLIRQKMVKKDSICSPALFETSAMLANIDYNFYGFEIRSILHQESWQRAIINNQFSDKIKYHSVDFNASIRNCATIEEVVNEDVDLMVSKDGIINGLVLTSEAVLDEENRIGWTSALNIPIIVPFDDMEVSEGEKIVACVRYSMGRGLENLSIRVMKNG